MSMTMEARMIHVQDDRLIVVDEHDEHWDVTGHDGRGHFDVEKVSRGRTERGLFTCRGPVLINPEIGYQGFDVSPDDNGKLRVNN